MPTSEAEVVALVEQARRRGQTLRVVGAGHSFSDIVCTDGQQVSLDRLDKVKNVEPDRGRVTVEAGIRLRDLVVHLHNLGLALPNLGSVAEQTAAGAISTGTHGTGVGVGNLASMVESLRMVTGTGEVVDVSADSHADLLDAARVGLGSLGIITELTMKCVPAFNLHERSWTLGFDEALRQMQTLVDRHDHVKFWWLPYTGRMQVFAADRTDRPCTRPTIMQRLDGSGTLTPLLSGVVGTGNRLPALVPALNALVVATYFAEYELIADSHRVFNLAMPPRHYESEYAFDRWDTEAALERIRALIEWEQMPVNFVTEVRFVAGDDMWLSPAYGRDTCQLGTYIGAMPQWRPYFEGVEAIAMDMGARPHWGKSFFAERDQLRQMYPRFDDFLAVRDRLDPDRIFQNDFTRRVLG